LEKFVFFARIAAVLISEFNSKSFIW